MDLTELTALRAGLKLFANTINEVARRSGYSPTYVQITLAGRVKNWQTNEACQTIIAEALALYKERDKESQQLKEKFTRTA